MKTELIEKYETLVPYLDKNAISNLGAPTTDLTSVDEIGEVMAYLRARGPKLF